MSSGICYIPWLAAETRVPRTACYWLNLGVQGWAILVCPIDFSTFGKVGHMSDLGLDKSDLFSSLGATPILGRKGREQLLLEETLRLS